MRITLVEIEAMNPATMTVETVRLSSAGYVTGRGDVPADTAYLPLLAAAPQSAQLMFGDGRTSGATRRAPGSIEVANADGRLDYLLGWGLDGRSVVVRTGPPDGSYPGDFPVWLRGTLDGVEVPDPGRLVFVLRDPMAALDVPLTTQRYSGTNVLPDGVEGTADDLQDRPKPLAFGRCLNVAPPCVNTSRLIYQVSAAAVADVTAVYDRGVALTRGADYASLAELQAAAPAAGGWRAWLGGGLVRLGSSAERVTCDVLEGAPLERSAAHLIARIATAVGVASISAADLAALAGAAPGEVGLWVDAELSALAAIDRIAASAGGWVGIDAAGTLRMGRLDAPTGAPVAVLLPHLVRSVRLLQSRDAGGGLPLRRMVVRYAKNWTVQSGADVAGVVSAERRSWLEQPDRIAAWDAPAAVLTLHPRAVDDERDTLLVDATAAAAEAARLGALYGVARQMFRVVISRPGMHQRMPGIVIGAVVRLVHARYGLGAGRDLRVIGIESRAAADEIILDLWG